MLLVEYSFIHSAMISLSARQLRIFSLSQNIVKGNEENQANRNKNSSVMLCKSQGSNVCMYGTSQVLGKSHAVPCVSSRKTPLLMLVGMCMFYERKPKM